MLIKRELGSQKHFKSELSFPLVVHKAEMIVYRFPDKPHYGNRQYTFELYEYDLKTDEPIIRAKKKGLWNKGQSFGFDLRKDYFLREGKRYCLKTTIYIENNREIFDVIFIKIR